MSLDKKFTKRRHSINY